MVSDKGFTLGEEVSYKGVQLKVCMSPAKALGLEGSSDCDFCYYKDERRYAWNSCYEIGDAFLGKRQCCLRGTPYIFMETNNDDKQAGEGQDTSSEAVHDQEAGIFRQHLDEP